jgi:phage baseplate assembly protein W
MSTVRYRAACFVLPYLDSDLGSPGLRLTARGRLATVSDAASVRQALLLLLSTRPGERVNRPTYGCHLFRLGFAPADDTTAGLAIHYVGRAVEQWEKRVDVLSLDASRPADEPWLLEIRMRYRIRATQEEDDLAVVVPVDAAGEWS